MAKPKGGNTPKPVRPGEKVGSREQPFEDELESGEPDDVGEDAWTDAPPAPATEAEHKPGVFERVLDKLGVHTHQSPEEARAVIDQAKSANAKPTDSGATGKLTKIPGKLRKHQ